MWIVRLALSKPYTFAVLAILLMLLGALSFLRMAKDIFPSVDLPVVAVVWSYNGLPPQEFERRITTVCERAMTTTVNDIEHIESQTLNGVCVIKVFFHEGAHIDAAVAQVTAINQTLVRTMPPGATPPLIVRYSASNVPILQLAISSKVLSEQEIQDIATQFLRTQLATVQGAQVPLPYGGKLRQVVVDLDLQALQAKGLSPSDVSEAVNAQNVILPTGTAKIGDREYNVVMNSSPLVLAALNNVPIKRVGNTTVFLRDVALVRDGFSPQTNIVHQEGRRATLLTVLKSGAASTLDIIERVRAVLPKIQATLPDGLEMSYLFDQSVFVRAALEGVQHEALIAAFLTAGMILLFLGSARSTLVVATSIPLSIACSLVGLYALGQTVNVMTLGGLALAVGVLVDDATVEIENLHRNLALGKPLKQAILDGAQQIAAPAFVSTTCICIVFIPVFFLKGVVYYLFSPLAMAAVFAIMSSYWLSRTVVPTMTQALLKHESHAHSEVGTAGEGGTAPTGLLSRLHHATNAGFLKLRAAYEDILRGCLQRRGLTLAAGFGFAGLSLAVLLPVLGQDFFPQVDAGQFRLHVRAPEGTRLEQSSVLFSRIQESIRRQIPAGDLDRMLDNIGLPPGGVNLTYGDAATLGPADGEILVSLSKDRTVATADIVQSLRNNLPREFPDCTFFFQPADIVGQILNFGLPAPIDIQLVGKTDQNYPVATELTARISKIPGVVDVRIHQTMHTPTLAVTVDRDRAKELGLNQRDVASDVLVSLSSSSQTAPNFWLNPRNGVNYRVAVQTPQYRVDSLEAVMHTPVSTGDGEPQLLANLATLKRTEAPGVVNHYNVQPVLDIFANVEGRDLGAAVRDVEKAVKEVEAKLPKGSSILMRGQALAMKQSYRQLGYGLLFAIVLVYLLLVVNFQSWLEPVIILMAIPGALCGIAWALFGTGTTLSVPALMGAIMSIGVGTANSILLISFANERLRAGDTPAEAAASAALIRLRPVLMTAMAMIIGMLPMALSLSEGGEQNAPLGRAVIGGLIFATLATLILVPVTYAALRKPHPKPTEPEHLSPEHAES